MFLFYTSITEFKKHTRVCVDPGDRRKIRRWSDFNSTEVKMLWCLWMDWIGVNYILHLYNYVKMNPKIMHSYNALMVHYINLDATWDPLNKNLRLVGIICIVRSSLGDSKGGADRGKTVEKTVERLLSFHKSNKVATSLLQVLTVNQEPRSPASHLDPGDLYRPAL